VLCVEGISEAWPELLDEEVSLLNVEHQALNRFFFFMVVTPHNLFLFLVKLRWLREFFFLESLKIGDLRLRLS
jgi:hypothetical protein